MFFNGAGFSLTLPLYAWSSRSICKGNSPPTAERHRWKIQWRAACFQAIVRGCLNVTRVYVILNSRVEWVPQHPENKRNLAPMRAEDKFTCIMPSAAEILHRESLERRASARLRARSMRREQRALVKIFPVCRSFSSFFPKRTRQNENNKNIRQLIKGKYYCLNSILTHTFFLLCQLK